MGIRTQPRPGRERPHLPAPSSSLAGGIVPDRGVATAVPLMSSSRRPRRRGRSLSDAARWLDAAGGGGGSSSRLARSSNTDLIRRPRKRASSLSRPPGDWPDTSCYCGFRPSRRFLSKLWSSCGAAADDPVRRLAAYLVGVLCAPASLLAGAVRVFCACTQACPLRRTTEGESVPRSAFPLMGLLTFAFASRHFYAVAENDFVGRCDLISLICSLPCQRCVRCNAVYALVAFW